MEKTSEIKKYLCDFPDKAKISGLVGKRHLIVNSYVEWSGFLYWKEPYVCNKEINVDFYALFILRGILISNDAIAGTDCASSYEVVHKLLSVDSLGNYYLREGEYSFYWDKWHGDCKKIYNDDIYKIRYKLNYDASEFYEIQEYGKIIELEEACRVVSEVISHLNINVHELFERFLKGEFITVTMPVEYFTFDPRIGNGRRMTEYRTGKTPIIDEDVSFKREEAIERLKRKIEIANEAVLRIEKERKEASEAAIREHKRKAEMAKEAERAKEAAIREAEKEAAIREAERVKRCRSNADEVKNNLVSIANDCSEQIAKILAVDLQDYHKSEDKYAQFLYTAVCASTLLRAIVF